NKEKCMDKDIHAVLKTMGCKQIATEWFNTSPDEIKRVINHLINGSPLGGKYTLRKRQDDVIKAFRHALDTKQKKFGLFAMPRFGKTICSFEMMNLLFERFPDKKYIFFISAKLDAEQALREDYYKFDQSCNFKLCLYDSDTKVTVEDLQKNKYLFFASKQWFDGKSLEEIRKRFPCVNREDCAAVFFDEAHFARMTNNAQGTIQLLNPSMQIDITGTPFRLKANEDYDDNNSYVYSVLDEYEDYENATNKDEFRLKNPELVYITPKNEFFKTDSSFGEFFDSDGCKDSIKEWVSKTFYGGQFNIDGKTLPITNAIVVLPPRRKYCDMFASAVNELVHDNKYAIKCTKTTTKDNDDRDYIPDNEQRFKEWNRMCKNEPNCFHLLVTIGKGLQAVSFPDCHAVIMLNDITSPEQYIQAAFRSKTPNRIKKEAYVIDYNKGRTLQIIDTFIKNHLMVKACDANYKTEYLRALSRINIRDHELVRQEYTFEEIFQTFISSWNIERITDSIDFDVAKLLREIDLSEIKLSDLQKPQQLTLQLTERGDDYEPAEPEDPTPGTDDGGDGTKHLPPDWLEKHIEQLKSDLVKYGYIPLGGKEEDRIKDINPADIERRDMPVGRNEESQEVWSYLGHDGDSDDIYIDESGKSPSTVRWKYVLNNKFVSVRGEESHGDGAADIKKAKAFINAIIRYLPAYFLVSGVPNDFDDFQNRFGRQTVSEKHVERKLFRDFIGLGIDYRYVFKILKACDAGSREQIIAYCADKVAKCYQDDKLIPEKVLELMWAYPKDGSRPVPKQLADIMRNGKNFDIAVCGGYWLTDETTRMYVTDGFCEAEIMKLLRPNCQVIYSNDILQTLEKHKETIMKFKAFIMNPPYGKLHLPILQKMVETVVENGGNGVSLQPVRWLQDPLKEHKQGTDFLRYGNLFDGNIANITVIPSTECGKIFDATFTMDLGVYEMCQTNTFSLRDLCKNALLEKILKKITDLSFEHTTIKKKIEEERISGIRVKVNEIQDNGRAGNGGRKSYIGLYQTFLVKDGLIDGKDWTQFIQKNQHSRQAGAMLPYSIAFANEETAKNFIDSTKTCFFQYLLLKMHQDIHMPNQWLPFMNDYSEPWTDERFYAYFDITPDEQKIIKKTVKDAKK
ncbi:MAG: DEAD/DEAH box helicase family protein, partial [Alphaproteobacteria bacterium]